MPRLAVLLDNDAHDGVVDRRLVALLGALHLGDASPRQERQGAVVKGNGGEGLAQRRLPALTRMTPALVVAIVLPSPICRRLAPSRSGGPCGRRF